jgi:hypothetical protein
LFVSRLDASWRLIRNGEWAWRKSTSESNGRACCRGTHITARAIALQDGRPIPVGVADGVPYVSALYATRLASNAVFDDGFEAR